MTVNMEKVLSKHDGPRDLGALVGKHLYIAVLVQEDTGGQQRRTCGQSPWEINAVLLLL